MIHKIKQIAKEIIELPNRKRNHKYIKELGRHPTLFPFDEPGYHEFDVRDTWQLNTTFIGWLYECLRYFEDEVSKTIDLHNWQYEIDGQTLTQFQCIKRMQNDCRIIIDYYDAADCHVATNEDFRIQQMVISAKDDLFKVFSAVFWEMWW